jgi:hypothetical protein
MDMNHYCLGTMAQERLADMRADAARYALRVQARPRPPLRIAVGLALIRIGRLLAGTRGDTLVSRAS